MKFPKAKRTNFSEELHGQIIKDPYRYMEDPDDPETLQWVKENNELLEDYLDPSLLSYFSDKLHDIVDFDRYTTVIEKGNRYFYEKHPGLKAQPSLYYREGLRGKDQLVVDFSELSKDGTLAPTVIAYSDDGNYVAYCLSESGSDWQELVIVETETGNEVDRLENIRFVTPQWTSDGDSFYYIKYPDMEDESSGIAKGGKVFLHQIGQAQSEDKEIYRPDTEDEIPNVKISEDKSLLFITTYLSSSMGTKFSIMDLDNMEVKTIHDEYSGVTFTPLQVVDNSLIVLTNEDAPLKKIIAIDLDDFDLVRANELIPETDYLIKNAKIAGEHIFISQLVNAVSTLKKYDLNGNFVEELDLPRMGTLLQISGKYQSPHLFFSHTSYPYLPVVYRYDIETGTSEVFFDNRVDFIHEQYTLKQVRYRSKDDTTISMFIIHRKDLTLDGNNPCLLWSYGGFNLSLTPGSHLRERYKVRMMIEEGGVYACPNIRGGGEYGREWHQAGTKENKQNVFDDFIAAAEYLIDEGYTSSDLLISHGGSNGGLLVAATLLQRPDLFGATVAEAGVMDMLRYHKFTFGRYWIGDYGNPDEEEDFEYLIAYSPVHNVEEAEYPPSLFYCADTDTRVVPMHSKKLVAELQHHQNADNPIFLRTETKAGHNFGKPISKVIEETAIMFSFIWQVLDLDKNHSD